MEAMYLPTPSDKPGEHFSGEAQKLRRTTGRLLDLMLDRIDEGSDPTFTREMAFEQVTAVKDDLPSALAALDNEIALHGGHIDADQWGWGATSPGSINQ